MSEVRTKPGALGAGTADDGTPLNYTLVNIKDWCKNTFEVVNQLRINTDYSHHRYDVLLLMNGVPVVQIEFKTLGISPGGRWNRSCRRKRPTTRKTPRGRRSP